MEDPEQPQHVGAHLLGGHLIGVRVVVRHLVPGARGPSGGPLTTDVLGVMEAWEPRLVIRREDGDRVEVERRLIVSGKPVPPRPSPRMRIDAAEVRRRLRLLGGDAPESVVLLGSVARAVRALGRRDAPGADVDVRVRVRADGVDEVEARVEVDGGTSRGRAACDDDSVLLTDLWTDPPVRRAGLASAVAAALLEHAAQRGARTVLARVAPTDDAALTGARALELREHHRG